MKKLCLTIVVFVFLLFISNVIQAQNTQTKLNQVELMKQLIGTWKGEFDNKDSCVIAEIKSYGNGGIEIYQKMLFKDEILSESKTVMGYDTKNDKYIGATINNKNPDILLRVAWFISENTYVLIPFEYISNPEQATSKAIYGFKSTDMFTATFVNKNKPDKTYTWVRVK